MRRVREMLRYRAVRAMPRIWRCRDLPVHLVRRPVAEARVRPPPVVIADPPAEPGAALAAFEEGHWGRKHPAIAQSWRRHWDQVIPFFAFPEGVRRIIYTTDEIDKTLSAKSCYGLLARATPWRRAEHRLRVPSGRLFTALPIWGVRAPCLSDGFPIGRRSVRRPAQRVGRRPSPGAAVT